MLLNLDGSFSGTVAVCVKGMVMNNAGVGEGDITTNPYPEVDAARCTGCGRCIAACAERLFTLEVSGYRKHSVLTEPLRCTRCLNCLAACPVGALGCTGE